MRSGVSDPEERESVRVPQAWSAKWEIRVILVSVDGHTAHTAQHSPFVLVGEGAEWSGGREGGSTTLGGSSQAERSTSEQTGCSGGQGLRVADPSHWLDPSAAGRNNLESLRTRTIEDDTRQPPFRFRPGVPPASVRSCMRPDRHSDALCCASIEGGRYHS